MVFNDCKPIWFYAFILTLAGCGSGSTESWNVGAPGGVMEWANGVTTSVPAGALADDTTFTVGEDDSALPEGFTAFGPVFLFGPAGLAFQKPVDVTLPVTAAIVPDTDVRFYWTLPGSGEHFVPLRNAICGSADCTAPVAHFSLGFVGTEDSCTPGDLRCLDDFAQVCGIDSMWAVDPEDCAAEDGCCEDGICVEERFCGPAQTGPIMCEPEQKDCLGDQWTLICTNENRFRRVTNCFADPDGLICRGGECVPMDNACWGNETRCVGNMMQECDENGQWRDKTDCANEGKTCVLASCIAVDQCVKDDVDCQGDVVVTCTGDPATWVPGLDCSAQGLICRAGSCSRACQDGEKRCAGQVAQSCDFTGKWKSLRDYANSGDECVDGECVDPDWCEKDDNRCEGNLAQSCGAFGVWVTVQDCSVDFNICVEGECVDPGDCLTGEKRCQDDLAQTCDENGQWQTVKDCGDDFDICFEGECIDSELCVENERKCLDDTVQICDATLTWQDDENCDASGKICVEGYCEDPPACQSGDLRCDEDTVQECNGAGNWIDVRDCAIDCLECHLGWCGADETGVCCSAPSIVTEPWSLVPPSECDMTKPYLPGADCADMKCCKIKYAYRYDVLPSSWCDYNQPTYEKSECSNLTCCKRKYQTFLMPASDCTPDGEIIDAAECDYSDRFDTMPVFVGKFGDYPNDYLWMTFKKWEDDTIRVERCEFKDYWEHGKGDKFASPYLYNNFFYLGEDGWSTNQVESFCVAPDDCGYVSGLWRDYFSHGGFTYEESISVDAAGTLENGFDVHADMYKADDGGGGYIKITEIDTTAVPTFKVYWQGDMHEKCGEIVVTTSGEEYAEAALSGSWEYHRVEAGSDILIRANLGCGKRFLYWAEYHDPTAVYRDNPLVIKNIDRDYELTAVCVDAP